MRVRWRGLELPARVVTDPKFKSDTFGRFEVEPFERAPAFRDAYLTDMLQYLIRSGRPITPVAIRGSWREIDTVQDLERARALLGSGMEAWK